MKQILCFFIGLSILVASGCSRIENNRAREVKKLMGRKIVFDSSLEPIACNMAEAQNPLDAKVKIVAYFAYHHINHFGPCAIPLRWPAGGLLVCFCSGSHKRYSILGGGSAGLSADIYAIR